MTNLLMLSHRVSAKSKLRVALEMLTGGCFLKEKGTAG